MEGMEEGLDEKQEKDGEHVVALVDSGGVVNFGWNFANFNFYFAV